MRNLPPLSRRGERVRDVVVMGLWGIFCGVVLAGIVSPVALYLGGVR